MSAVALGPRTAGRPTHSTGTPLDFRTRDHLFDLLGVELDPAFLAKFIEAVRRARALLRRDDRRRVAVVGGVVRRQFGVDRLVVGLGGGIGRAIRLRSGFARPAAPLARASFLSVFLSDWLVGFVGRRFAHRHAVVEPEHDDDGVGLLGGEDALGRGGPVGRVALGLIFDEAGDGLVPCGSRPCPAVRHRRPQDRRRASPPWRRRAPARCAPARSSRFSGGGALEKFSTALRRLLLEWREQIAAEPAAAAAGLAARCGAIRRN